MKIKNIKVRNFKRFTDLEITQIPKSAKLVVLVGPNGSGKSSLFEALNHWYRLYAYGSIGSQDYFEKKDFVSDESNWYNNKVAVDFHNDNKSQGKELKGKFYFRTAYRNEADFTVDTLRHQSSPIENSKHETLNGNDVTVSENYQRLISQILAGVFDSKNNSKLMEIFRDELIGVIRNSLKNVFEDLTLSSIGDPLSNGSFYFEKGNSKDFHYKNLSAGEKSAFDIILDLIIKSKYYNNSVFCVDEPEAHMHTRLQSSLLLEMYHLIPENSQLWIATHSIGMLKQAEELERDNSNSVVFLNFDNRDFDSFELIVPTKIDKSIWDKFFELALADFSKLIAPKRIVFCEGTPKGRKYKDFDAQIYTKIFEQKYHDTAFVSLGSCTEIENIDNQSVSVISSIFTSVRTNNIQKRPVKS